MPRRRREPRSGGTSGGWGGPITLEYARFQPLVSIRPIDNQQTSPSEITKKRVKVNTNMNDLIRDKMISLLGKQAAISTYPSYGHIKLSFLGDIYALHIEVGKSYIIPKVELPFFVMKGVRSPYPTLRNLCFRNITHAQPITEQLPTMVLEDSFQNTKLFCKKDFNIEKGILFFECTRIQSLGGINNEILVSDFQGTTIFIPRTAKVAEIKWNF